jgi:hypothetical protein
MNYSKINNKVEIDLRTYLIARFEKGLLDLYDLNSMCDQIYKKIYDLEIENLELKKENEKLKNSGSST